MGDNRSVDLVTAELKARLRAELQAARRARSAEDLAAARSAVRAAVLAQLDVTGWATVAAYVPLRTEPGSAELLDALAGAGVRVLVPVLLADLDLDWVRWDPAATGPGTPLGREAITSADAVLVPALAVALDGTRLGRGGGSYDRALRRVPPGTPVAALLFDGELLDTLPGEAWDVPVRAAVTPAGWRRLSA